MSETHEERAWRWLGDSGIVGHREHRCVAWLAAEFAAVAKEASEGVSPSLGERAPHEPQTLARAEAPKSAHFSTDVAALIAEARDRYEYHEEEIGPYGPVSLVRRLADALDNAATRDAASALRYVTDEEAEARS